MLSTSERAPRHCGHCNRVLPWRALRPGFFRGYAKPCTRSVETERHDLAIESRPFLEILLCAPDCTKAKPPGTSLDERVLRSYRQKSTADGTLPEVYSRQSFQSTIATQRVLLPSFSMRRARRPSHSLSPFVLWVFALKLVLDLRVYFFPECGKILCGLNRVVARSEDLKKDWDAAVTNGR